MRIALHDRVIKNLGTVNNPNVRSLGLRPGLLRK